MVATIEQHESGHCAFAFAMGADKVCVELDGGVFTVKPVPALPELPAFEMGVIVRDLLAGMTAEAMINGHPYPSSVDDLITNSDHGALDVETLESLQPMLGGIDLDRSVVITAAKLHETNLKHPNLMSDVAAIIRTITCDGDRVWIDSTGNLTGE